MNSDLTFTDAASSFTLVCPGYRGAASHEGAGRSEGKLTFTIGAQVVAEIDHLDLLESWQAAKGLKPRESAKMVQIAADHLSEILDSGLAAGDLTEAVTDAAVVFLLAMKRSGIKDPKRIPACTVMWNGHKGEERVFFGT